VVFSGKRLTGFIHVSTLVQSFQNKELEYIYQ